MRDDVSSAFGDVTLVRDAHTRDDEDAGVATSTGPHVLGEEGDFGGCAFGGLGVGAAEVDGLGLGSVGGRGGGGGGMDERGGKDGDSLCSVRFGLKTQEKRRVVSQSADQVRERIDPN